MNPTVFICVLGILIIVALSGCATPPPQSSERSSSHTPTPKETEVIEALSENGCMIEAFRTASGPGKRAAIEVQCK